MLIQRFLAAKHLIAVLAIESMVLGNAMLASSLDGCKDALTGLASKRVIRVAVVLVGFGAAECKIAGAAITMFRGLLVLEQC